MFLPWLPLQVPTLTHSSTQPKRSKNNIDNDREPLDSDGRAPMDEKFLYIFVFLLKIISNCREIFLPAHPDNKGRRTWR